MIKAHKRMLPRPILIILFILSNHEMGEKNVPGTFLTGERRGFNI